MAEPFPFGQSSANMKVKFIETNDERLKKEGEDQ